MVTAARIGSSPVSHRLGPYADENLLHPWRKRTGRVSCPPPANQAKLAPRAAERSWDRNLNGQLLHGANVHIVIVKPHAEMPGHSGSTSPRYCAPPAILRISPDIDVPSGASGRPKTVVVGATISQRVSLIRWRKHYFNPAERWEDPGADAPCWASWPDYLVAYCAGSTGFSRESIAPRARRST